MYHNFPNVPDIRRVVVLSPGEECGAHDGLGVVRWDLPQAVVRLQTSLGQLQVQVSPTWVHLQHLKIIRGWLVGWSWIVDANLDGRLVRVVDLNDRRVAWVQRELHTDQRLEKKLLMRKIHHKWSSLERILRYSNKIWFQSQSFEFSPVLQCCLTQ